ncbi:hypothetical protein [Actinocrispum wychmicini]|uniref:hypothetical protein n=1 Tax=Actinocrispum wychmicini TaxID=1213861 RepID=UPI00104A2C92|nr:hypothetical protein [Actinocrispum wychmicini]
MDQQQRGNLALDTAVSVALVGYQAIHTPDAKVTLLIASGVVFLFWAGVYESTRLTLEERPDD